MKRKSRTIKLWIAVLAVLLIGSLSSASVCAQDYDSGREGSITIRLNEIGTDVSNVVFECYKIADVKADPDICWVLDPGLEDTGVNLNELKTAADYETAANMLLSGIEVMSMEGEKAETDGEGTAVYSSLQQGVYLLVQMDAADYGTVEPFLVAIPYVDENSEWIYDVRTETKGVTTQREPENQYEEKEPEVPEKEEKKTDGPKTGDTENIMWYAGIMACAGVIVILSAAVWYRQRKRNE